MSIPEKSKHFRLSASGVPKSPPLIIIMSLNSSYFGSHSAPGGKVRVADSSALLNALKIQVIQNAAAVSKTTPSVTSETPGVRLTNRLQYNPVSQQINYGVKYTNSSQ